MHSDQPYFPGKPMLPLDDQVGYYMQNSPMSSVFNGFVPPGIINPFMPFSNVNIQPSAACPRNFIIFDQTNNRSQIMFHPETTPKLFCPGFGLETSVFQDNADKKDAANVDSKTTSTLKEDSDDIDALLSTEYEENQDSDDELVSTARTDAVIYECSSPDSCSNSKASSSRRSYFRKMSSGSRDGGKKRQRMRKMVKALRGIVPGANRMSTVAVLDEAVRYLKSLRVEVQKLGVGNTKG